MSKDYFMQLLGLFSIFGAFTKLFTFYEHSHFIYLLILNFDMHKCVVRYNTVLV